MTINVTTDYSIIINKRTYRELPITNLAEHLKTLEIDCIDDLRSYILDFIWDIPNDELIDFKDFNWCDIEEVITDNIDELVEYFSELVNLDYKFSCCDGQIGNYCSTCGKKLK